MVEIRLPALRDYPGKERKAILDDLIRAEKATLWPMRRSLLKLDKEARAVVMSYSFPGNFRELRNMVLSLYARNLDEATVADLPERMRDPRQAEPESLAEVERLHITRMLARYEGNLSATSKALGIARNTLTSKMRKYDLHVPGQAAGHPFP